MTPALSDEAEAATADLIVALALGRTRRSGRPCANRVRSLLAAVAHSPNSTNRVGGLEVVSAPVVPRRPAPRRILCTDREVAGAESLARSLRLGGFDARGCADGADALVEVTDFLPHACVLDIEMPGVGGYELAGWVRSEVGGLVFLIGVSDRVGDETDRIAVEAGFDLVLARPVDTNLVIGLLGGSVRPKDR